MSLLIEFAVLQDTAERILGNLYNRERAIEVKSWLRKNKSYLPNYIDPDYANAAVELYFDTQVRAS